MSRPKAINPNAIYQPIRAAAELTGISRYSITKGCREGTIPHIRVGADYRVNMPLYLEQLEREAWSNGEE